jgi:hypothetical protein
MRLKILALSCATLALSFHPESAFADPIKTLHFDEIPQTHIPPPLHVFGITFSFTEDITIPPGQGKGADYGAPFTGATTNLGKTVLLGNDPGVLTLTFDTPTTLLSFEEASAVTTTNVFEVRLFNKNGFSLGTTNVVTNPAPCSPPTPTCSNLSQGSFSYNNSGGPIAKAVLDFSSLVPGITPAAFAIDDLTYVLPTVPTVPEPSPSWLLLCGVAFVSLQKARRLLRNNHSST